MNINREICVITANQLENENPARNRILSLINGFLNKGYQVKLISMDSEAYSIVKHDNFEHYKTTFQTIEKKFVIVNIQTVSESEINTLKYYFPALNIDNTENNY